MIDKNEFPANFEEKSKQRYAKIAKPELSFEQHLAIEKGNFQTAAKLAAGALATYIPSPSGITPCGNGDLEIDITTTSEWQGAYGTLPLPAVNPFAGFAAGLVPGPINLGTSHHTWVNSGNDPIVGIPLTAPSGSSTGLPSGGAVRIGNAVNGYGCELISKTFTVTASRRLIKFWYAVVLQNPIGHDASIQPYFWVRVTDAAGSEIPGAVNLGSFANPAKVVADSANPFFQTQIGTPPGYTPADPNTTICYKNWTCAQINLSSQLGKTVTVEFISADCGAGGHFGYAYLDNFCGTCDGSPEGNITFDAGTSSKCGAGNLCFNYSLPRVLAPTGVYVTGSIAITLDIYQNGALVTSLNSPVLTSGTGYCFAVDPSTWPLDPNLEAFDFVATGAFAIGNTVLAPMQVGAAPDGTLAGQNNDYQAKCKFFSYAVKFVCGAVSECSCECGPLRPGGYATEINIYNHNPVSAAIRKRVIPLILAGAPAGREPAFVSQRAEDRIDLPPYCATMDDCCRIGELLFGAPTQGPMAPTVGFLEIVSPVELSITAVYTVTGQDGKSLGIDVKQIEGKVVRI